MLFLHLFRRNNSTAKVGELHQLVLDGLQTLVPLSVSGLHIRSIPAETPKLLIQLLYLGDLHPEAPDLFPKNP